MRRARRHQRARPSARSTDATASLFRVHFRINAQERSPSRPPWAGQLPRAASGITGDRVDGERASVNLPLGPRPTLYID
jgi:hypothetical protein